MERYRQEMMRLYGKSTSKNDTVPVKASEAPPEKNNNPAPEEEEKIIPESFHEAREANQEIPPEPSRKDGRFGPPRAAGWEQPSPAAPSRRALGPYRPPIRRRRASSARRTGTAPHPPWAPAGKSCPPPHRKRAQRSQSSAPQRGLLRTL